MKNKSDSNQTAFNIEQKFCEDDICWEEIKIDFDTSNADIDIIQTNKALYKNIIKESRMLMEIADSDTEYFYDDIKRRPNFELNGGIKLAIDKGARLKETRVLVEAEAKDVPAFDTLFDTERKEQKQLAEQTAMDNIRAMLEEEPGKELQALWLEFEAKQTFEAKVANALDKLEAQLQHNEASMDTWLEIEKEMVYLLKPHTEFHPVLDELRQVIVAEAEEKMEAHGSVQSVGLSE